MPPEYNPDTSEIRYEGNVVGRYEVQDSKASSSNSGKRRVQKID
jgi:hypothetical protein